MPPIAEPTTEYDRFDYDESSQVRSLEEAIALAKAMRSANSSLVFRVVPTDDTETHFKVQAFSKEEQYADFLTRMANWWGRIISHRRLR